MTQTNEKPSNFLHFIGWPVICGLLIAVLYLQHKKITGIEQALEQGSVAQPALIHQSVNSYSHAVMKAIPSVANIYSLKRIQRRRSSVFDEPFFDHFFNFGAPPQRHRIESSLGSGVIVSPDGFLLTNHHVIEGADEIIVVLHDGRESRATIVGTDPEIDLAVLKIELDNLEAIAFADIETASIGDVVLAIGNPFGFGQTVTQGIISATSRQGLSIASNYIQTDAAINRGNSGGALVNTNGDLLGINTVIYSETGSSIGIGFAIPVDTAMKVLDDINTHGRVLRGSLGIVPTTVPPQTARALGIDEGIGILVSAIFKNGPAHQAGLMPGDIIAEVDGQTITGDEGGLDTIARTTPGEEVHATVIRQGQILDIPITPGIL